MRTPLALSLLLSVPLWAEEPSIEVNPNRPTFATPAATTQSGVAELEWGLQRSTLRDDGTTFGTPTLLKFGLIKDLELRLSTPGFLRLAPVGDPTASGLGDLSLGAQWCYLHDGLFGMDQAVQLAHTFPTAPSSQGLGNGAPIDTLTLIFSRDAGPYHVDVNLLESWIGLAPDAGGGRATQTAGTVSITRNLNDQWSITGELYALQATPLNAQITSNLWAVAYKASKRLVLDAGVDVGLSHGAPRYTVFTGLTVGLGRFRKP
ncbi:MAG: transporter [Geothrix sp.]|uniref:transporter n=1 Tax=Geothrix sp. TaxID=1962974 RepID=UPI00180B5541|nr:transporter [Geothrix sp.]NWJ42197.1 transporter [Geothrix sp.]WIL19840.1 MAG: transporter [Geothrix sp.]